MNYYYVDENNQQIGPCSAEQIRQLYQKGILHENSWIIEEGAAEWKSYTSLFTSLINDGQYGGRMKRCTSCGMENEDEAQFCAECGMHLEIPSNLNNTVVGCSSCQQPPITPNHQQTDLSHQTVSDSAAVIPHKRRRLLVSMIVATACVLTILTVVVVFYPSLTRSVQGWHRFSDKASGFTVSCPPNWRFMQSDEFKTTFSTGYRTADICERSVICVTTNSINPNCLITFGDDVSRFASTKGATREFLRKVQPKETELNKEARQQLISQRIYDFAGGVASETVIEGWDNQGFSKLKWKVVLLIAKKRAFNITCTAKSSVFDEIDRKVFQPMMDSIDVK